MNSLRFKTVLLTGATGWIGRNLVPFLAPLCKRLITPRLYEDILDVDTPVDVVIHAAFSKNPLTQRVGTNYVLDLAERCLAEKLLLLSSGAARPPLGVDPYAWSKNYDETLCCESAIPEVKIARIYTLAGPHIPLDGRFALGRFIGQAFHGGNVRLQGYGDSLRSYMHMEDLCRWLLKILEDGHDRIPYDVGSDQPVTIASVAHMVADYFKVKVVQDLTEVQPTTVYLPNSSQVRELKLEITIPLDQAIQKTCESVVDELAYLPNRGRNGYSGGDRGVS